jgi:hypothetical protein
VAEQNATDVGELNEIACSGGWGDVESNNDPDAAWGNGAAPATAGSSSMDDWGGGDGAMEIDQMPSRVGEPRRQWDLDEDEEDTMGDPSGGKYDWECPDCSFVNFAYRTDCRECLLMRPANVKLIRFSVRAHASVLCSSLFEERASVGSRDDDLAPEWGAVIIVAEGRRDSGSAGRLAVPGV